MPEPQDLHFTIRAADLADAAERIEDVMVREDLVFESIVVTRDPQPPDPTIGPWG